MGEKVGGEWIYIYFYATVLSLLLRETELSFLAFHRAWMMQKIKR